MKLHYSFTISIESGTYNKILISPQNRSVSYIRINDLIHCHEQKKKVYINLQKESGFGGI